METPMSYLAKRGSVYYFRRVVPDDIRPVLAKAEIMKSLRTKDREEVKRLIPAEIIQSDALFAEARKGHAVPVARPTLSPVQIEQERKRWEHEQAEAAWQDEQAAKDDDEAEQEKGLAVDPVGARLLADVREQVEVARLQGEALPGLLWKTGAHRKAKIKPLSASLTPQHLSEQASISIPTSLIYGSPAAKTKDSYKRVAEWLHERIGRKSVEQFIPASRIGFGYLTILDGQRLGIFKDHRGKAIKVVGYCRRSVPVHRSLPWHHRYGG
jgi:hypothetical protein